MRCQSLHPVSFRRLSPRLSRRLPWAYDKGGSPFPREEKREGTTELENTPWDLVSLSQVFLSRPPEHVTFGVIPLQVVLRWLNTSLQSVDTEHPVLSL